MTRQLDYQPLLTPAEVAAMFGVDPRTVTGGRKQAGSRRCGPSAATAGTPRLRCGDC